MVQIINLGVGFILAVVLVVGFCQRHKWTKGTSIFGHLMKGKIGNLVGKAQRKMGDHEAVGSTLEEVKEKNNAVKAEEGGSNCVDFEDERKRRQDESITKQMQENSCKDNEQEIVGHVELLEEGENSNQVVVAIRQLADAREEVENISKEEPCQ